MIEQLKQLAGLRKDLATYKADEKEWKQKVEESLPGMALTESSKRRKATEATIEALEKDIKQVAINTLKLDPLAELAKGLIKKTKTIYAYTKEQAETWAKTNAPYLFTFDEAAFKEVAKSKNAPDFVKVTTEPDVQLASDLSAYLEEEPVNEENLD